MGGPSGCAISPKGSVQSQPAAAVDEAVALGRQHREQPLADDLQVGDAGLHLGELGGRPRVQSAADPAVPAPASLVDGGGTMVPANPYDFWTLNLELTPIYAVEPVRPYAASVYELLIRLLAGEVAEGT
jgi:hypothetical protein